jgi:hypothetical protein
MAGAPLILDRFMADYETRPWVWSWVDCCMALADLSIAYGTDDPAAGMRGSYASEDDYHALVRQRGGLLPFGERLVRVGWRETEAPSDGCAAVIGSPTEPTRQWGAIRYRGKWNVRMDVGWIAFTAGPLAIWEFRCLNS